MKKNTYRKQKYPSCQLIAAINARIFLGLGDIDDEEFERLVDLTLCRHGAAIQVHKAYLALGLDYEYGQCLFGWVRTHLPVEIAVRTPHEGLHAILIVGVKKAVLEVVNLKYTRRVKWQTLKKKLIGSEK